MPQPAKVIGIVLLAAAAFVAGKLTTGPPSASATVSVDAAKKVLYWACPMHPQYKVDHPGDAPCCGMRLEPVYADSVTGGAARSLPPGTVEISAERQQVAGVRTGEVTLAPVSHLLRVPGRVAVDEARLFRIMAAADGWIRELGANSAGTFVKKDEMLASYYTPGFLTAQQSLMYANETTDLSKPLTQLRSRQMLPASLNLQAAIDGLRSLGMSELQLDAFKANNVITPNIYLYAPSTGYVVARNISPNQRFDKGIELYRIANIEHVWAIVDIFERDREFLRPGVMATIRYRGREFPARMSNVLPQFDAQSRLLRARFELDNPGNVLRPDEFVDVEIHVQMPAAITVPADAVMDSGRRKTVFVAHGNGIFEPRQVETGWRLGDRVEITNGLKAGEGIVISGNFLLDSESRLQLAAAQAVKPPMPKAAQVDPICGMEVDPAKAVHRSKYQEKTVLFCSKDCKEKFDADPARYAKKDAGRS